MRKLNFYLLGMMLLLLSSIHLQANALNKTDFYFKLFLPYQSNQAPIIDPNILKRFSWETSSIHLDVTTSDSPDDTLVYEWTQLSGPSDVIFGSPFSEGTTVVLPVYGESYLLQLTVSDGIMKSNRQVAINYDFLANYINPSQQRLPEDGIYPLGQRMPIGGYSSLTYTHEHPDAYHHLKIMANAGFSMDGPLYSDQAGAPNHYWTAAEELGLKGWHRLFIPNYDGNRHWAAVLPLMQSPEGRQNLRQQIENMINAVQADPARNAHVVAWYGYPEEAIYRDTTPIEEQRDYLRLIHETIMSTDKKKRPYYVIERGDSDLVNMTGNACFQDGSMKQNYLIRRNGYEDDTKMRYRMHQWARDQVATAETADRECPSYTGAKRAAISALEMFRDPDDLTERNEAWLRKAITHDIYTQLAAGIDGFVVNTWADSTSLSQTTKSLQENLYLEILGQMSGAGLGSVFLWGEDRDDLSLEVIDGPAALDWYGLSKPTIQMRNIQYGNSRFVLLVNSARENVMVNLSYFPPGMHYLDIISETWHTLGSTFEETIEPLGVRIFKIERI